MERRSCEHERSKSFELDARRGSKGDAPTSKTAYSCSFLQDIKRLGDLLRVDGLLHGCLQDDWRVEQWFVVLGMRAGEMSSAQTAATNDTTTTHDDL